MASETLVSRPRRHICAKLLCLCVTLLCLLALVPMSALAAGATTTITQGVSDGMKEVYNLIGSVTLPVASVVFAFNAIRMMMGGQRSMENAKNGMLVCCIVIAIVWFAPVIINTVGGWFKGGSVWSFDTFTVT